jgi:hypothetical protein
MKSIRLLPAAILLLLPGAIDASAATIVADGLRCTLAEAIVAANTNAGAGGCPAGDDRSGGGDIIKLTADVTLALVDNVDAAGCPTGLPAVTSTIRIDGHHHTIARAGAALDRPWFRILDSTAGTLTLHEVTVSNGFLEGFPEPCDGAGINGTVALVNSTVSGNNIVNGNGGGINGVVTLTDSTVADNNTASGNGGGINGTATLFNSTVSGNCTGCQPVQARLAARTARMATLSAGGMSNEGGGIAGAATLVNSTVSGNFGYGGRQGAGGGLAIDGAATIVNSTVSDNVGSSDIGIGGGLHLYRGVATITNSTISGNTAFGTQTMVSGSGGGIFSSGVFPDTLGPGGPVTLVHSTVSGNKSIFFGGSSGPPSFDEARGAGIFGAAVTLVGTIVGGNTASNAVDGDCFSSEIRFADVNLIGDGSCGAAAGGQLTGEPMLGPLADYGGPAPFQPLLAGSPAIDRIAFVPDIGCGSTTVIADERGVARPTDGSCDLGAIEYTGFPANPVLDNFNRSDGKLGPEWSGERDPASYRILNHQLRVRDGGPLYWSPTSFGADQEAYVTLTNIDDNDREHVLLLKVQGESANYTLGEIEVLYDARSHVARVETLLPGRSTWTKYHDIPVTFEDGNQFGGRVHATGQVDIFRNNVRLATVTLKARDRRFFNQAGGRIGLWFDTAPKAMLDSFGGGSVDR